MRRSTVFFTAAAVVALVSGAAGPERWPSDGGARARIPFDDAKIMIEFNATAEDADIQVFLDGEPWRKLKIVGPNGRLIFAVEGKGSLRRLGLTELFLESEEPPRENLPLEEFLAMFPEGEYEFLAKTVEGDDLTGTATLTHDIPDGPSILSPEEGERADPGNTVIRWEPVTGPAGIEIVGYRVVVDRDDRVFGVDLSAETTSVTVPPGFLEPDTEYGFEVLAIEEGGNQTITHGSFQTE